MYVLLSFLDLQLPKTAFLEDGNLFLLLLFFFFLLFVSQSSYFKKLVKIKIKKGRKRERGKERKEKIDSFTKLSCLRKSGMNE